VTIATSGEFRKSRLHPPLPDRYLPTQQLHRRQRLLSFDVGLAAHDLSVRHLDNGVWSAYTPGSFSYDSNGIASFTVDSFSGYVVTQMVSEPRALGLIMVAGLVTLRRRRGMSGSIMFIPSRRSLQPPKSPLFYFAISAIQRRIGCRRIDGLQRA